MTRLLYVALGCLLFCFAGRPQASPGAWRKIEVCTGDEARREAANRIQGFAKLLDHKPALADATRDWNALLDQTCLRLPARLLHVSLHSVEQLSAWWREGGEKYLRAYLSSFPPSSGPRTLTTPPEQRRLLAKELAKKQGQVPAALLCGDPEEICDPDAQEAVLAFEAGDSTEERFRRSACQVDPDSRTYCATQSRELPPRQRFASFMECVFWSSGRKSARYPIGGLRLPRSGWLVLTGRRGHYRFCEEVRAYDLESGAAYIASSCGGLVLREDGRADGAASARTTIPTYKVGRMSADAIRRITFLLATKEIVREERSVPAELELPEGMRPIWWERDGFLVAMFGRGCGGWGHSGQNTIDWSWRDGERILASGSFLWPEASNPVDDAVSGRLHDAEAALVDGCAPRALPANILEGTAAEDRFHPHRPRTSEARADFAEKIGRAFEQARRTPLCAVPKP